MRIRMLMAATALLVIAFAPAAAAATTMKMTMQEGAEAEAGLITVTVDGKLLRMDLEPADGKERSSVIFRGDRDELIVLEHAKSKATVIDKATIEQLAAQVKQAMAQMEQMMAKVPAEQREMMRGMMKGKMPGMMAEPPAPIEIRKTSETGSTNGYSWVKYEAYQEGEKVSDYLVTDWSNLDTDASIWEVFKELGLFFEEITKSFGAAAPLTSQNPFEEMNKLDGFPVVSRHYSNGVLLDSTTLTSVSSGDVAPALFENPGYKVQKLEPPQGR